MRRLVMSLMLTGGAPACKSAPDRSCATPEGGLTVRYVGQAYGYGTIRVEPDESSESLAVYAHMLGPDSMAEIDLSGVGSCQSGTLRAQLGGGRDDASGLRVLGGGLIILFQHDPMATIVGFWDVRAVRDGSDDGPDGRRFRGMLEAVDQTEVIDTASAIPATAAVQSETNAQHSH